MMQKIIFIVVSIFLLTSAAMSNLFKRKKRPAVYENSITVKGSTRNIEGHAAVDANSAGIFFMAGMNEWEPGWINQPVKVTGDLELRKQPKGDTVLKFIRAAVVLLNP